jgi:hypothetical protein
MTYLSDQGGLRVANINVEGVHQLQPRVMSEYEIATLKVANAFGVSSCNESLITQICPSLERLG